MKPVLMIVTITVAALLGAASVANAQDPRGSVISKVGVDQRLGSSINLDLPFRDETGAAITLRRYFGARPVIIAPVYFSCPSLCPMTLNGLNQALNILPLKAERDFEVIIFSFDPNDTPETALQARSRYFRENGRPGGGIHFLTGDDKSIAQLTRDIGFRYVWDPESKQWAHATAIAVATPEGVIAQYFYGLEYSARDLRLSLVEASEGKVGSLVDRVLLYCFRYDPATGKYGPSIIRVLRIFGAGVAVGLFTLMIALFRREGRSGKRP